MKVIVDTSVWSLALRRDAQTGADAVSALRNLIHDHRVQMIGPIRQEVLSGIRHESQFNRLKTYLNAFSDLPIHREDYVSAAKLFKFRMADSA